MSINAFDRISKEIERMKLNLNKNSSNKVHLKPITLSTKTAKKEIIEKEKLINKSTKPKNQPKIFDDFNFEEPPSDNLIPIQNKTYSRDQQFWQFYDLQTVPLI